MMLAGLTRAALLAGGASALAAVPASAESAVPAGHAAFWSLLDPTISMGLGWIETAAITLAAGQIFRWTGVQISQTLQDRVHRAADTGLHAALATLEGAIDQGLTGKGRLQVLARAAAYVNAYVPRALAVLGVTPEQLEDLVLSKLAKASIAAAAGRPARPEDPAMARVAGPVGPGRAQS